VTGAVACSDGRIVRWMLTTEWRKGLEAARAEGRGAAQGLSTTEAH
jgi:hypothetical protein